MNVYSPTLYKEQRVVNRYVITSQYMFFSDVVCPYYFHNPTVIMFLHVSFLFVFLSHVTDGLTLQWRHNGCDGVSNYHHMVVYSAVYSGADQIKHQSFASLAFVRGIHRWPVNSPHKGPVTRKMFPFDNVIVTCYCIWQDLMENNLWLMNYPGKIYFHDKIKTGVKLRYYRYLLNIEIRESIFPPVVMIPW